MPEPNNDEVAEAIRELEATGVDAYRKLIEGRPASGLLRVSQVTALTGWSEHTVRSRAERGDFRGAILYDDTGWSIPWTSVVVFQAEALRRTRERAKDA